MSHQLLFVCAANVCRSPLMELTFTQSKSPGIDEANWRVWSRGASVVRQQPMCELAASLAMGSAAQDHLSMSLTPNDLKSADLVIVASRDERARVARVAPSVRSRTFTLREALALGSIAADEGDAGRFVEDPREDDVSLASYAALLHQRRGRVAISQRTRLRLPWKASVDPQDVPDVHHESRRNHSRVLIEVRGLVRELHTRLGDYLDPHL